MTNLDKLIGYFEKFPGIGGRQARRFAFHILTMSPTDTEELARLITTLQSSVTECASCHRFFSRNGGSAAVCTICDDPNRDRSKLLVVARDSDVQPIERAAAYDGLYFVLGGTIPLLDAIDGAKLRGGALKQRITERIKNDGLAELILAFAVNPDGENTARYVEKLTTEIDLPFPFKISQMGRGLSTGSELEYADPETIKNALRNRV